MKIPKILISLGLSALMFSCADESPWSNSTYSEGNGAIKLHLSSSTDLSSEIPNFRSISSDIVGPPTSQFNVRMTSKDGSYVKNWSSIDDFEKESQFTAGVYTIEAFYGSPDAQGIVKDGDEGYEYAYYYGIAENVKVEPGKDTDVSINAKLGNAVVIIEYSDAFKNYFKDWGTELVTKGETPLELGQEEGKCYVVPGDVDVIISATQQNGKSVKLNPAVFEAEPQHLYKIKYNIYNGEVGHAEKLELIFNDDPVATHAITIELTDDLLSGTGPVITPEGFSNSGQLETLSGSPYQGVVKFNIDSPDGYSQAILTIKSDSYKPDFLDNGVIDLCSASPSQQDALAKSGIRVLGLYNNPQRMALVDLTEFCRYLPEGKHEINLMVKDRDRVSDASVTLVTFPIAIDAAPYCPAVFGRRYADLLLSYNGADPTIAGNNPFSFKVLGDTGYQDVEIKSISLAPASRTFESIDYVYRIFLPESYREDVPVEVYFNNSQNAVSITSIEMAYPQYEVIYDPMATKVMMKISKVNDSEIDFTNAEVQKIFNDRLRVFVNNYEVSKSNISRNTTSGVITASGLGGEDFTIKTSLEAAPEAKAYSEEQSYRYEAKTPVPNGNFENTSNFLNVSINQGGQYKSLANNGRYNTETYNVNVPNEWANVNSKTCNFNASNAKNTWFIAPSTYSTTGHNGQGVAIRTVGYNYNGNVPASTGTLFSTTTYNTDSPSPGYTATGKLFLGSYSAEISNFTFFGESYSEGYAFTSRPMKLKGWYKYNPYSNDKGYVSIKIKFGETILASGTYSFEDSGDWSQFEVILNTNYTFNVKPNSLEIMFMSSNQGGYDWQTENNNVSAQAITGTTQKFLGSELIIDELEFEY